MNKHVNSLLNMAHAFQCCSDGISSKDLRAAAAEIKRLEVLVKEQTPTIKLAEKRVRELREDLLTSNLKAD
jgi:flagellar biosynthesis chaperone FliJ